VFSCSCWLEGRQLLQVASSHTTHNFDVWSNHKASTDFLTHKTHHHRHSQFNTMTLSDYVHQLNHHHQRVVKHKRRYCKHASGCDRIVKSQGLCQRHGATAKKCRVEGCEKQAQGNFNRMCSKCITALLLFDLRSLCGNSTTSINQ